MGKKNRKNDPTPQEETFEELLRNAQTTEPTRRERKAFKGDTGYNYGADYQYRSGRPPSKTDWDAMSQEQRDQIGLSNFSDWKDAARNWRAGFAPGGGNWAAQGSLRDALVSGGAQNWGDVQRIAAQLGYTGRPDEGQALLRRLKMAFEGASDPSGRYHWSPDGWVDVGTSDLAKRGIAGRADYNGPRMGGIQAVLAGLAASPQAAEDEYFQRLVNQGDWTLDEASGQYFNDPGNDPTQRQWVDRRNLQPIGTGYRSIHDPTRGPVIDYSQVDQTKERLSDYLSGRYRQQQAQQQATNDYNSRAANANPYTPGAPNPTTSNTAPAWGAPRVQQMPQPQKTPTTNYSYQPRPQQPSQPRVLGQPRPRNNVWGGFR